MKGLHLGEDFALPIETVTDTIGVLAIKGAGKTYTFLVMVEEMVKRGFPVVVLDPVGVAWGLRLDKDGKSKGLDVLILGGRNGDVPLEASAGKVIADFVIAERRPCVLDMSAFETKADQMRFVLDFATRLYHANRDAIHVVMDEADDYCPQRPFGEEARTLRAVEVLVRRGRARGIGVTLVTQRAAAINKGVLTQCGTLILGTTISPQDRKAVQAWVDAASTTEEKAAFWESLASLPTREKWIWSPARGVFSRVKIRPRVTFDSSATPKVGAPAVRPPVLGAVDIASLKDRIAATIERAKADDPRELRKRVSELEKRLKEAERAKPAAGAPAPKRVEVNVLDKALVARLEKAADRAEKAHREAAEEHMLAIGALEGIRQAAARVSTPSAYVPLTVSRRSADTPAPTLRITKVPAAATGEGSGELGKCERAILSVLAQYGARSKVPLAILAGYSSKSGGFRNALSALRTAGFITRGFDMEITDAGARALGPIDPLPTGAELLEHWKQNAGGVCERVILSVLAEAYPKGLGKDAIAEKTGRFKDDGLPYSAASGGFRNALSRLRSLKLIEGKGEMRLDSTLAEAS